MLKLNFQLQCLGGLVTEFATTYKTIFWGLGISALVSSFHFQNLESLINSQDDVSCDEDSNFSGRSAMRDQLELVF